MRSVTRSPSAASFPVILSSLVVVELFSGVLQVYFTPLYAALGLKYHVSIGTLSWALTAFTLSSVVLTPLLARLGDLHGHRRILKIEAAIVAVGSVLVAVAPDFGVLLAGRVLQGAYAAYLPLMFGLVRSRFSTDHLRRGVAYLTSVLIFGVVVGLITVGAILRTTADPTWVLWLPALGTIVGLGLIWLAPNEQSDQVPDRPPASSVDWPGVLLLGGGLVAIVFALTEGPTWGWASARIIGLLILGGLVLALWVQVERHTGQPLADVRFLFRPVLVPVYVVGFCIYFAAVGSQVAVATFVLLPGRALGYGLSQSSWHLSLFFSLVYLFTFVAAANTARSGRIIGFRRTMALGALLAALGYGGLVLTDTSLVGFLVSFAVAGLGIGFIEGSTRTVIVDSLRLGEVAMGEGIYELAITLGGAVGAAVFGGVLSAHAVPRQAFATLSGYQAAFLLMTALALVAAIVAIGFCAADRVRAHPADAAPTATAEEVPAPTQ